MYIYSQPYYYPKYLSYTLLFISFNDTCNVWGDNVDSYSLAKVDPHKNIVFTKDIVVISLNPI